MSFSRPSKSTAPVRSQADEVDDYLCSSSQEPTSLPGGTGWTSPTEGWTSCPALPSMPLGAKDNFCRETVTSKRSPKEAGASVPGVVLNQKVRRYKQALGAV